jgi:gas vesicle protein
MQSFYSNNLKLRIMNTGKLLLGVLAGITAGALFGILFAPDKGYKTRKRILKTGKNYANGLTEKFEDLMEETTDKLKSAVKKMKDPNKKEVINVGNSN